LRYHIDIYQYVENRAMHNLFTTEHQARIMMEDRRTEAQHHARLALARSTRTWRDAAPAPATFDRLRNRLGGVIRLTRTANCQPACQPGMAC
jgi:hypothetical protein